MFFALFSSSTSAQGSTKWYWSASLVSFDSWMKWRVVLVLSVQLINARHVQRPEISYATLWVWQRSRSREISQKVLSSKNQLKLEIQQQVTDFGLVRDIYQFYSQSARALIKANADANRKPNGPMTSIELTDCDRDLACSTKGGRAIKSQQF